MRCHQAQRYLSEYVDGTLRPDLEASFLRHVEQCAGCRALLRDFEAIKGEARNLERLVPPDSAWLKIRADLRKSGMLGGKVVAPARRSTVGAFLSWLGLGKAASPGAARSPFRPAFPGFGHGLVTATITVLVLVAVFGLLYLRPWQSALSAEEAAVDKFTLAKLDEAQWHYEQSIKALNEALAAQRGSLDPELSKVFQTNLAVVDASIETCRQAVRRDPRDLQAQYALLASYKDKIQLMTDFIATPRSPGIGQTSGS